LIGGDFMKGCLYSFHPWE